MVKPKPSFLLFLTLVFPFAKPVFAQSQRWDLSRCDRQDGFAQNLSEQRYAWLRQQVGQNKRVLSAKDAPPRNCVIPGEAFVYRLGDGRFVLVQFSDQDKETIVAVWEEKR